MSHAPLRALRAYGIGAFTGLILGVWEMTALALAPPPTPWGESALHILSFCGIFGALFGLLWALIAPSVTAILPPFSRRWFGLNLTEQEKSVYLSVSIASTLALGLTCVFIYGAVVLSHSFNRASLAGGFSVLISLIGVLLSLSLWPRIYLTVKGLIQTLVPSSTVGGLPLSVLPWICLVLSLIGALFMISTLPLGAYQLGGYWALISALPISLMLLWVSGRLGGLFSLRGALVTSAFIICLPIYSWRGWDQESISNQILPQQGSLSSLMLSVARRVTDRDGDGVSSAFGGGDCDDTDPKVNPQAKEIPDNGIDDNCNNGDLKTPPPPPPPEVVKVEARPTRRWNVLLLLVDTLRANHLDHYGYERPTMPNLTTFAQDAVTFDRAFAHAPRTPFSIPSLLTGLYPSRIKWVKRFANYSKLTDDNLTLFERFKRGGWRTEAVSAHWYFGTKKGVNLKQGLDAWDNRGERSVSKSNTQSEASGITRRLIDRLSELSKGDADQPFFMFAHYFAPHGRYMLHATRCKRSKKWCHVEPKCKEHPTGCTFGSSKARGVEKFMNAYDSELSYVDLYLGDVFKAIKDLKLDEDTIVIVTSDHGESFKDRKPAYLFHGRSVHNEELHVPLIIRTPESSAKRVDSIVGLVDLTSTLSELTGVDRGPTDGESLKTLLGSGEMSTALKERVLYLEQLPYPGHKVHITAAIDSSGQKLIRNLTNQTWALYNLNTDWGERKNLLTRTPKAGGALRDALSQYIELTP